MMAAGASYVGDVWIFMGPASLPFVVPYDRIRLNAFGRQAYRLWRRLAALGRAAAAIEADLLANKVRSVGPPSSDRRDTDAFMTGTIEVVRRNTVT